MHFLQIQHSLTVFHRFIQFFILFFALIYILNYFGKTLYEINLLFFVIMIIPYMYYLLKEMIQYFTGLTFKTVKGRIQILIITLLLIMFSQLFI